MSAQIFLLQLFFTGSGGFFEPLIVPKIIMTLSEGHVRHPRRVIGFLTPLTWVT